MINFTNLPTRNKFYAGANGAKRAVIYQGEQYMLKFPAQAPKNKDLSYANSCITEYKTMLQTRKERILDFAMEKLRKREKSKELEAR